MILCVWSYNSSSIVKRRRKDELLSQLYKILLTNRFYKHLRAQQIVDTAPGIIEELINQKIHHLNGQLGERNRNNNNINIISISTASIHLFCTWFGPFARHRLHLFKTMYVQSGINYGPMCHYAWYILWFAIHQLNLHEVKSIVYGYGCGAKQGAAE